MKYSDDEGDGVGMHDDMDDLDGGTVINLCQTPLLLPSHDQSVPSGHLTPFVHLEATLSDLLQL